MNIRSTLLGLAALLALGGAIVLNVLSLSTASVLGGWAVFALLFLAWVALNHQSLWAFLSKRSTRYGANLSLIVFLVFSILVFLNILGREYHWRKDLTRLSVNSLSPQTLKVLGDLNQEVKAYYFASLQDKDKGEALLKTYGYHSKHFKFEFVDTARRPTLTKSMDVKRNDTVVLTLGESAKTIKVEGSSEEKVTNGLLKLLRGKDLVVYFTSGHEEHPLEAGSDPESQSSSYSIAKLELEKQGYTVRDLNLLTAGKVPADAGVLVSAGPRSTFFPKEIEILRDWLNAGGHALLAFDLDIRVSGLAAGSRQLALLLAPYQIQAGDLMLIDPTSRAANVEPSVLLGFADSRDHVITRDFAHSAMVANFLFPLTTFFTRGGNPVAGVTITPLVSSGKQAWAESDWVSLKKGTAGFDPNTDKSGPLELAYAIERKAAKDGQKDGRLVVFADALWASNALLDKVGNRDLFLNSVAWLSDEERFISIRAKEEDDGLKQYSNVALNLILLLTVFVIPLGTVCAGVAVWWKRSKL
jgi:ABC-type uncharacterized transport system involved in gliding motility auxiliary subunit